MKNEDMKVAPWSNQSRATMAALDLLNQGAAFMSSFFNETCKIMKIQIPHFQLPPYE
jgi:hypothetical protein